MSGERTRPCPPRNIWPSLLARLQSEGLVRQQGRAVHQHDYRRESPQCRLAGWVAWFFKHPCALVCRQCFSCLVADRRCPRGYADRSLGRHVLPSSFRRRSRQRYSRRPSGSGPGRATWRSGPEPNARWRYEACHGLAPGQNASLALSLQENLGIVDHLIAACEKSMLEQPDNPVVRQYLYGAYQQKAVLLATAIDRSTLEER